jgi:hypothetical protein
VTFVPVTVARPTSLRKFLIRVKGLVKFSSKNVLRNADQSTNVKERHAKSNTQRTTISDVIQEYKLLLVMLYIHAVLFTSLHTRCAVHVVHVVQVKSSCVVK